MDSNEPDAGEVFFDGKPTKTNRRLDAEAIGISTRMTVVDLLPDEALDRPITEFLQHDDEPPRSHRAERPGFVGRGRSYFERTFDRIAMAKGTSWVTFAIVALATLFVFAQLSPKLIFTDTTPTGGDMGAHVWGPAFMRDHLLSSLRFTGWTKDYYAGMPMFFFYMVPPALAIVLLSFLVPYGVAFKLVSISGLVTLPICCYVFGRLMRLRFPGPALLAVGAVPFLFYDGFTIYGGNVFSTMAGEYSYSISLSFMMLFLGVFYRGLETGKHRVLAAVLFAMTMLCHVVGGVFAAIAALVMFSVHLIRRAPSRQPGERRVFAAIVWDRRRLLFAASVATLGVLLAGFWLLPLQARLGFTTNMRYEKKHEFLKLLLPTNIRWVAMFAAVGFVWSVFARARGAFYIGMFTLAAWITVVLWPEHQAWNMRFLPYWFLGVFLMAAYFLSVVCRGIPAAATALVTRRLMANPDNQLPASEIAASRQRFISIGASVFAVVTMLGVGLFLGFVLRILPGASGSEYGNSYTWPGSWAPFHFTTTKHNWARSWVKGNFTGYERRAEYPEYHDLMVTMGQVGNEQGCGRALWENVKRTDSYGSSLALMLLPMWTNGCIGSMEGLYYETSATTPYHFLTASLTSEKPSNPVRGLKYDPLDLKKGVVAMRMLGVKYYMAYSDAAKNAAKAQPDLTRIGVSGNWEIYQVSAVSLVSSLDYLPAVVTPATATGKIPKWQDIGVKFFQNQDQQAVYLAASGPADWPRVPSGSTPLQRPLDPVVITNVVENEDSVTFDVSKVGVPVLVRESYFPNWKVEGGSGPYRVTPNFMVVIPRSTHVKLYFGWTGVDYAGWMATFAGLALAIWLGRFRRTPLVYAPDPVSPVVAVAGAANASADGVFGSLLAEAELPPERPPEPGKPPE